VRNNFTMHKALPASMILAGLAAAAPVGQNTTLAASGPLSTTNEVVAYWGNGDGKDLREYCTDSSGIDVVVLSFIDQYGDGKAPSGGFNEPSDGYCTINGDGSGSCPNLASDIKECQSKGKKVILSVGGGGAPGTLSSTGDAQGVAYSLWNSYGNPDFKDSGDSSPRPFGDAFVNGFDFDIETTSGESHYAALIQKLQSYFTRDSSNQYLITGAPQCVLPEANMGNIIENAAFDRLWVQWYNNYQDCDASNYVYGPQAEGASFNYDQWTNYLSGTPSRNAKILVGLPASKTAAASQSWIDPKDLPKLVDYVQDKPMFGGIMFWEASESDKYQGANSCNYAQEVSNILKTGGTC